MKKNEKKIDKNEELKELKKKLFYKKENVFENQTKIILTLTVTDTINYGNIIDEEALCSKIHESSETTKESAMTNNNEASYLFKLALPYTTMLSESKRKNPFDQ